MRISFLSLVLVAAVAIAGCGGDDGPSVPDTGTLVSWGLNTLVSERGTIEVIDLHRKENGRWE